MQNCILEILGVLDRLTEYEEQIQETNERLARTFAEGEMVGLQKAARLMKTEGMSTEAIARCTGLAAEVIESL